MRFAYHSPAHQGLDRVCKFGNWRKANATVCPYLTLSKTASRLAIATPVTKILNMRGNFVCYAEIAISCATSSGLGSRSAYPRSQTVLL